MGKIVNNGKQDLSLQIPGCVHHSVALHEFLHALGFAHEQTRPDRDRYVRISYENIQAGTIIMRQFDVTHVLINGIVHLGHAHNFDRYSTS
jgi:hypothetical protein